jgi:hypothetical protein
VCQQLLCCFGNDSVKCCFLGACSLVFELRRRIPGRVHRAVMARGAAGKDSTLVVFPLLSIRRSRRAGCVDEFLFNQEEPNMTDSVPGSEPRPYEDQLNRSQAP